jgi:hypothetical protein
MTRILLNRPHTHAGRLYAPGDRLDVPADTADWLIAQGAAHLAPEPAKSKSGPDKSPTPFPEEPQP